MEQSVDCSEITGVDISMMVSVLLKNTVQRDILDRKGQGHDPNIFEVSLLTSVVG